VRPLQLDVTVAAERDAAVRRILDEQGRIDGLVNNAGRALGGFLEQVDEDELRAVLDVNVVGAFAMTKAVLPAMRAQRSGAVVMVSSMSGRMAFPALGTYATSKFALEGMSEAWRHELALFGVRVVLVEPGAYATDIWERNRAVCRHGRDPDSPYAPFVDRVDRRFKDLVERQMGDPQEVADRICDLLVHPSPALRHPMGKDARLRTLLVRLAPFRLVEALVGRVLRP
jgi:NAD(P)-dependent dehydrogenase (short-subunit alcohol dehydrogenase family)